MTAYVVMDRASRPVGSETEFVRDGLSMLAFIAPVIWLAWHRLWIEAFVALAAAIGLAALGTLAGFQSTAPLLSLLISVFVAIEGPQLRIAALARRGWRHVATVEAGSVSEAELRFFAATADDAPAKALADRQPPPVKPAASQPQVTAGPALGLFEYPGGR